MREVYPFPADTRIFRLGETAAVVEDVVAHLGEFTDAVGFRGPALLVGYAGGALAVRKRA
ncbi:hypothetical protein ILP97_00830 [Amycolatopsis sp. H6(2020)]|nr:hypothetical protein [Amycolatopsis sp. H6(2020)]